MNKTSYIYLITNKINNHKYVGQTIDPHKRWLEHCRKSNNSCVIDKAINKYGKENFSFEILEECKTSDANEREIFWIEYYNTYKNKEDYNCHIGGKMQNKENNPMYGKKGFDSPLSKITKELSESIYNDRLQNKNLTIYDLSEKYRINTTTISKILRGIHWSNKSAENLIKDSFLISGKSNKFNLDYKKCEKIYNEYKNNDITFAELSKKYNIAYNTIRKICKSIFYYTKDKPTIEKNKSTSSKFTKEEKQEIFNEYLTIKNKYKTKEEVYKQLIKKYPKLSKRTAQRICKENR